MLHDLNILGDVSGDRSQILTTEALCFLQALHDRFELKRQNLLKTRIVIAENIRLGLIPARLQETEWIRISDWQIPPLPLDLQDRRVEITGPAEAKMMINALNSDAQVFMADLEDSLSPTWANVIDGQVNLQAAVQRRLRFTAEDGREYKLKPLISTLIVRPRGWHLTEAHVTVRGHAISASLFDFGLFFFHNASMLQAQGTGPYFYLPKLENHLEARLWNEVFVFAQDFMGLAHGTIRATVLIETILAAFEMEEILFELREHAAGLNAGRWDYIFSMIKKFSHRKDLIFADRAQLTMGIPYMQAYSKILVDICHKRGAHAIGGMAAFIPSRRDPMINQLAMEKVREDKMREAKLGFDGTWVAHPDLVPVAFEVFQNILSGAPHQKSKRSPTPWAADLLPTPLVTGTVTTQGVANNVSVALQYLNSWLQGVGAVAIFNLMEDAATAEIARAELWQWVHHQVRTSDNVLIDGNHFTNVLNDTVNDLGGLRVGRLKEAAELLTDLVLSEDFCEFLTLPAYKLLNDFKNTILEGDQNVRNYSRAELEKRC